MRKTKYVNLKVKGVNILIFLEKIADWWKEYVESQDNDSGLLIHMQENWNSLGNMIIRTILRSELEYALNCENK